MNSAYTRDLIHQRDRAIAERHAAEDELGKLRRHVAKLIEERDSARQEASLWFNTAVGVTAKYTYTRGAYQSTIVEARRQAARAEQAEARMGELESALNWETSCLACARVLDSSYAETTRAEQAEARIAVVRAAVADVRATRGLLGAVVADQIENALGDVPSAGLDWLINATKPHTFTPAPSADCTCAGCCPPDNRRPAQAEPAHTCWIWEDDGEWNVSCRTCPAYVDSIGDEDDAEEWAEEHQATAEDQP